ncbi:MAG TPA: hypothetical protein PL037_01910, partial [Elusimicrobiales bacterium]|nr:hypothetical protein [Elusimicrobiales bacterium]
VSFSNVIYDTHPPVSFITAPANLASYRTLASITGTMSEKPDASASAVNSGVALTQVQIQRLTAPASYWTGADWSDSASWLTASTPTASSWQITGSSVPAWEHGKQYLVTVKSLDMAGNQETAFQVGEDSCSFHYDVLQPTAALTVPRDGATLNETQTQITGTAYDSPADVDTVEIAISSSAGGGVGNWLTVGGTFTGNDPWYSAAGGVPTNWAWAKPGSLENSKSYLVKVRTRDKAVPYNERIQDFTFTYDTLAPVSGIISPAASVTHLKSLSLVTGTASDPNLLAGATVQVRVSTGTSWPYESDCWTGSGWQTCVPGSYRLGARKTGGDTNWTWEFDSLPPTWRNDTVYKIQVWAIDSDGREQSPGAVTVTTFTIDTANALSTTTFPLFGAAFSSLSQISGTASDPGAGAGVDPDKVYVAIEKETNSSYWDPTLAGGAGTFGPGGCAGSACVIWSTASYAGGAWTYTQINTANFDADRKYRVMVKAVDKLGNAPVITDADIDAYGIQIVVDKTPPVSVTTQPVVSDGISAYLNYKPDAFFGTASDPGNNPAGLHSVKIRVSRLDSLQNRGWYNWDGAWNVTGDFIQPVQPGSLSAWTGPTLTKNDFPEGYRYEIQTQALDFSSNTAGALTNYETALSTVAFIVDMTTPTFRSLTFSTQTLNYVFSTVKATGTLLDPPPSPVGGSVVSGVDKVYYKLQDISNGAQHTQADGYYWNGSTWTVDVSTLEAGVHSSSWTIGSPYGVLPSTSYWARWDPSPIGRKYRISMWVKDRATNVTDPAAAYADLIFDSSAPVSAVVNPAPPDGAVLDIIGVLSGTAMDPSTSTIKWVYVSVQNRADNGQGDCQDPQTRGKYWGGATGSDWTGFSETWLPATSYDPDTKVWAFSPSPAINWDPDCYYVVKSSAVDRAGNYQVYVSSRDFKYVAANAETKLLVPVGPDIKYYSANQASYLSKISGTANIYTTEVRMELRRKSDGYYWSDPATSHNGSWIADSTYVVVAVQPVPANWDYGFNSPPWVDNSSYTVKITGYNSAGRPENTSAEAEFKIDSAAPETYLAYPGASDFYGNLGMIYGTASDPGAGASGIKKARVRLQRQGTPDWKYYDNASSSWTDTSAWNEAPWGGSSWTFVINHPTVAWQNGITYKLEVYSLDKAIAPDIGAFDGNDDKTYSLKVFTYDTEGATATLTAPAHGGIYSSLAVTSGTVADNNLPVANIRLFIHDQSENAYWNGDEWLRWADYYVQASTFVTVFNDSWTYTVPSGVGFGAPGSNRKKYTLWTAAQDRALNSQTAFSTVTLSSMTVVFDHDAPVIDNVSVNVSTRVNSLTAISGRVWDQGYEAVNPALLANVSTNTNVEIQISYLHNGDTYYYNDTVFSSNTVLTWRNPSPNDGYTPLGVSSGTWVYSRGAIGAGGGWISDRSYTIRIRGRDNALPSPNVSDPAVEITDVVIDTTPPSSLISAPGASDVLIRALPSISGTASGDLAGLERMEFSIKRTTAAADYFDGSDFTSGATVYFLASGGTGNGASVSWSSAAAAGLLSRLADGTTYTIHAYATDFAGNSQKTSGGAPSRTFRWYVDGAAPTSAVLVPASMVVSTLPAIAGTANDVTGSVTGAPGAIAGAWVRIKRLTPSTRWWDRTTQNFEDMPAESAWFSPYTSDNYA